MPPRSKSKIKRYIIRGVLVTMLLVILWQIETIVGPLSYVTTSFSSSFMRGGQYITEEVSQMKVYFRQKQVLYDEITRLKQRVNTLQVETFGYTLLKQENETLKDLHDQTSVDEGVLASVISKPNRSPYDTLIVDVGEGKTVEVGNIVVFGETMLGIVDAVYGRAVKIRLFSSPGVELDIVIGDGHIPATIVGRGGGAFRTTLPRGISVEEKDIALFPSFEARIIGTVEKVESKQSHSFQTILLSSPVNIFELRWLTILPQFIFSLDE